jgi:hypothetical protein
LTPCPVSYFIHIHGDAGLSLGGTFLRAAGNIGIAAFSVLLLGISISAYRKTILKGRIYAAIAIGLFAVQLFDCFEDAIKAVSGHTTMSYSTRCPPYWYYSFLQ